jgi:hypothetical protein
MKVQQYAERTVTMGVVDACIGSQVEYTECSDVPQWYSIEECLESEHQINEWDSKVTKHETDALLRR